MKVQIQPFNNDPANSFLDVYQDSTRPICRIDEDAFAELLNDKDLNKFIDGVAYSFNVNKNRLFDLAFRIF